MSITTETDPLAHALVEWFSAKARLDALKTEERKLRDAVIQLAFPELEEGTNKLEMDVDGYPTRVKVVNSLRRTVDEAALADVLPKLPKSAQDKVVRWKPQLNMSAYKRLSATARKTMDQAVITKPGSPSLSVEYIAPEDNGQDQQAAEA